MRAVVYQGAHDVRVENVPDPQIMDERDAIVKVTATAICGSDLHLYDGYIPTTEHGDIFGHEFMGEVVETGPEVKNLKKGDRVVVPFPIACGTCVYCKKGLYALCENSNPNHELMEKVYGYSGAGIFGYSHLYGGYPGGQAEYARVPFADVGPIKITDGLTDEQVLFLSDIFPTGYQAAENGNIQGGETVAIWGCGPVGQFAIKSAFMLGAGRVIAIDRFPERLEMARRDGGAEVINYAQTDDVVQALKDMTDGRGPGVCIDAVGMEAHGAGFMGFYDKMKQTVRLESDRPTALREILQACGKGGTVSIAGVYGGLLDKFPLGAAFAKGLTIKMGQTQVHRYLRPLLTMIKEGKIDPSFVVTHRLELDDAPHGYDIFRKKEDGCIKVVMKP